MKATKAPESGVKHVMTTIWGDEGNECDVYVGSSLLESKLIDLPDILVSRVCITMQSMVTRGILKSM